MRFTRVFGALLVLAAGGVLSFNFLFKVPNADTVVVTDGVADRQQTSVQCRQFSAPQPLDNHGDIKVLVWNIYKQNKPGWRHELDSYLPHIQLGLLQEVSMSDEFKQWLYHADWVGQQATAFEAFDATAGVFNLAHVYPTSICAQLANEPWLRLPKSALFATYLLSDGATLGVGNLHGINFTLGTHDYAQQLAKLTDKLGQHIGPVILGGDFNSWNSERLQALRQAMVSAGLSEVVYTPDRRTRFLDGQVLDHIFYRGLKLDKAEASTSDASDHNPLTAKFSLIE
ncbi:endonuclease/exonuclease/phosphatase family protein [Vibrio gallicus]|uniref:endonuclease/exonuclease/phosphatase family protein n=1 Tax=Vibrio gallicus TaxID=190897 RepID=UPI0021C39359|nr:endonuclease/exonuclease/phosphatase family protein [Vibrio gallicus]